MKMFLQLGLILLAFCMVATALLAYVNSFTKPRIEAIKLKEAADARNELIPDSEFEEITGDLSYYIARDKTTKEIKGYTFTAEQIGYGGPVKTMAAVDKDFKIISIKVIQQTETPGLGTNATLPKFTDQFKGKTLDQLTVDKDGGVPPNAIKALTGATITTRAVANAVKASIDKLRASVSQSPETAALSDSTAALEVAK
ncbi:RnfABCDGE type electron transport complex subunit G [Candidatus Cloacimonadaceae bacterium]